MANNFPRFLRKIIACVYSVKSARACSVNLSVNRCIVSDQGNMFCFVMLAGRQFSYCPFSLAYSLDKIRHFSDFFGNLNDEIKLK